MEKISSFIPSTFNLVENYTVQVQQTRGETRLFPRKGFPGATCDFPQSSITWAAANAL